jgi:hypothetical protein
MPDQMDGMMSEVLAGHWRRVWRGTDTTLAGDETAPSHDAGLTPIRSLLATFGIAPATY